MTTEIKKPRAGFTLYQATLKRFQAMRESADGSANYFACKFADEQKPEDRTNYLVYRARCMVWDEAINGLTDSGGDWMRLDFPKEV